MVGGQRYEVGSNVQFGRRLGDGGKGEGMLVTGVIGEFS